MCGGVFFSERERGREDEEEDEEGGRGGLRGGREGEKRILEGEEEKAVI